MNRPPDSASLLGDILAESEPPDFRAALLGETLRLARRRRLGRRVQRATAVASVMAALAFLLLQAPAPSPLALPAPPAPAPYALVRSEALPANTLVRTSPLGADRFVASFASVSTVHTPTTDRGFRLIDDDELLALAAPRSAALIRVGPSTQELIFDDAPEPTDSR